MWTLKQEPVCAIVSKTHAKNTALKMTMSSESATRLILSGCEAVSRVSRWLKSVAAPARSEFGLPGVASFAMAVTRSAPRERAMTESSQESSLNIARRKPVSHTSG
jgi:hypothetical protein